MQFQDVGMATLRELKEAATQDNQEHITELIAIELDENPNETLFWDRQ